MPGSRSICMLDVGGGFVCSYVLLPCRRPLSRVTCRLCWFLWLCSKERIQLVNVILGCACASTDPPARICFGLVGAVGLPPLHKKNDRGGSACSRCCGCAPLSLAGHYTWHAVRWRLRQVCPWASGRVCLSACFLPSLRHVQHVLFCFVMFCFVVTATWVHMTSPAPCTRPDERSNHKTASHVEPVLFRSISWPPRIMHRHASHVRSRARSTR